MPRKRKLADEWHQSLRPGTVRELFEYLPSMLYFAKDTERRLMAGNRAFVQRCGLETEADLIGRKDTDLYPAELAEKYASDDRIVLSTGEALMGIVELYPNALGEPEWYVTDKIPLFTREGKIAGLCGLIRRLEGTHAEIESYSQLREVTDHLDKVYQTKVSVEELASMAGMSVRQLERRFKEAFKTTPMQYVMKLRILKACQRLSSSQDSITEIALEVGFYDHSSFTKKFVQMIGNTPREYRQKFLREK